MIKPDDRQIVLADLKERAIWLKENNFDLPEEGIYDEPVRYYKANLNWARIIEGWVDWLADVSAWRQAQDDSFRGIHEILVWEEGIELPTEINCEDIENCLETSPTIEEIKDSIGDTNDKQETGFDPSNYDKDIAEAKNFTDASQPAFTPSNGCDDSDKDALWGAITSLLEYLNNRNLDFLQQIALANSVTDGVQKAIEIIPLLELHPAANTIDFIQWLVSFANDIYLAATTTDALNELACEIFCEAVNNGCQFTLNQIRDKFGADSALASRDSIDTTLISISQSYGISGIAVFEALSYLQLMLPTYGEFFGGVASLKPYEKAIKAGALSPSRAWSVYCDECEEPSEDWVAVFDFTGFYSPLADEIVYRPPFNLKLWGANSVNEVNVVIGKGLVARHISGSAGTRRMIEFSALTNVQNVEYRGYMQTGNANIFIESTSFAGWAIPSTVQDSGVVGGANNNDRLLILFGNVTGGWTAVIEWIKIKSHSTPANVLPPPKLI